MGGMKGFTWLVLPGHNPSLREAGAGTQAGTEAETTGEMLLTGSLSLLS